MRALIARASLVRSANTPLIYCEVGPMYHHRLIHHLSTVRWGQYTTMDHYQMVSIPLIHYKVGPIYSLYLVNIPPVCCEVGLIYSLHHSSITRQNITYMEHLHIVLPSIYHKKYCAHIYSKELIIYQSSMHMTRSKP